MDGGLDLLAACDLSAYYSAITYLFKFTLQEIVLVKNISFLNSILFYNIVNIEYDTPVTALFKHADIIFKVKIFFNFQKELFTLSKSKIFKFISSERSL